MTNSWLLPRIVELIATYLVHSTLLLGGLALVIFLRDSRYQAQRRTVEPHPILHPALAEWLWKLGAVLPVITASFSVFAGLSQPLLEWSIKTHQGPDDSIAEVSTGVSMGTSETFDGFRSKSFTEIDAEHSTLDDFELAIPPNSTQVDGTISYDRVGRDSNCDRNRLAGDPGSTFELVSVPLRVEMAKDQNDRQLGSEAFITHEALPVQQTPTSLGTDKTPSHWLALTGPAILAWIVVSALRLLGGTILVHRYVSGCRPITGALRNELDRLASGRSIRLLRAVPQRDRASQEPFACGIWMWTIVLPEGIEHQLTTEEVTGLLAHEVAHLIRRDPWWQCLGELLCTCFAFQPLNFLARRRWQQSAELLCDDWAAGRHVSPMALASCLTRIVELRLEHRRHAVGLPAVGQPGSLSHRVEWLLRSKRADESGFRRPLSATVVALTLGIALGGFAPRLTLSSPVEAAVDLDDSTAPDTAIRSLREEIHGELSATLKELQQVQMLLPADSSAEFATTTKRLRDHVMSIQARLEQVRGKPVEKD